MSSMEARKTKLVELTRNMKTCAELKTIGRRKINILFLDFDEVFLTQRSKYNVDPIATELIADLCIQHELNIVICSSHRLLGEEHCKKILQEAKLWEYVYINDMFTKNFYHSQYNRGIEVADWISRHNITNYLIIDDDSDFLPEQDNNIVHPDIMNGMLMEHYLECCKICDNFK